MVSLKEKLPVPLKDMILEGIDHWMSSLRDSPSAKHLRTNLFKKYVPCGRTDPVLGERAKATFLETENRCKLFNRKILQSRHGTTSYADAAVLMVASRKIERILGKFDIDEMVQLGRFGPGSTFSCRGSDISKARKFSLTDVTPEFNKLARGLLAEYPLWAMSLADADYPVCPVLEIVPGGRYLTVEKNSETDRSIIVEPTINSWFQQGIGRMIRKRLKRSTGVDLDDQTTNRRLARLGSITDDLATVDLSSASDLICKALVLDLLPKDWYFWLNATRSHRVLIDGTWVELEKFSSMGNGFTFDLQSLIFYAISTAVTELEGFNPFWVNVFGDDIVVPSGTKERFCKLFDDVGFQPNIKKSFFSGPFRESCGHDYHLGENIRSVYLRRLETFFDLMVFHNRLYEWADRTNSDIKELRGMILSIFEDFPCRVPVHLGDLGLSSSFDEVCPEVARVHPKTLGWDGFRAKIAMPYFQKEERFDRFVVLSKLQGSQFQFNFIEKREKNPLGFRICDTVTNW